MVVTIAELGPDGGRAESELLGVGDLFSEGSNRSVPSVVLETHDASSNLALIVEEGQLVVDGSLEGVSVRVVGLGDDLVGVAISHPGWPVDVLVRLSGSHGGWSEGQAVASDGTGDLLDELVDTSWSSEGRRDVEVVIELDSLEERISAVVLVDLLRDVGEELSEVGL